MIDIEAMLPSLLTQAAPKITYLKWQMTIFPLARRTRMCDLKIQVQRRAAEIPSAFQNPLAFVPSQSLCSMQ